MAVLTFTTSESSSSTRNLTFTLPNLNELTSVISNTGNVSVQSISGDVVTVRVSGGSSTRSEITGWSSNPDLTKYVENQTSPNYSDSSGYSGNLSSYLFTVTNPAQSGIGDIIRTLNYIDYTEMSIAGLSPFPSSVSYDNDGYKGTIYKSGGVYRTGNEYIYQRYSGRVVRPESTSEVTRYRGTVRKSVADSPVYTYYYKYNLTFNYIDFVAPPVYINGQWREVKEVFANVNGAWRKVTNIYGNVDGVWKHHVK